MSINNIKNVAIMMINWHGGKDTLECLESLEKIDYPKEKISIWVADNNSTDDSLIILRPKIAAMKNQGWDNVQLLELNDNYGSPGGFNRIYEHIYDDVEVLIRLDNDVIVEPTSISKIVQRLDSESDIGIVGIQSFFYDQPDVSCSGAWYVNWTFNKHYVTRPQTVVECDVIVGNFMAIAHDTVKKLDVFFDDKLFICADEFDLCMRVKQQLNLKIIYDPEITCYHKSASSTSKTAQIVKYFSYRNGVLMYHRYAPHNLTRLTGYLMIILTLIKAILLGDKIKILGYVHGLLSYYISKESLEQWKQKYI